MFYELPEGFWTVVEGQKGNGPGRKPSEAVHGPLRRLKAAL